MVTESKSGLNEALLAAQAEFPEIPKDRENTYFKSRYSTLDAIKTACWPVLHKHGILPRHKTTQENGTLTVTFMLTHAATGETDANSLSIEAGANVQAIGSQITYLRRYTCAPALGICSDEDDDGNAGAEQTPKKPATTNKRPNKTPPRKAPPRISDDTDLGAWERHDLEAYLASCNSAAELLTLLDRLCATPEWFSNTVDWQWACKQIATRYRADARYRSQKESADLVRRLKEEHQKLEELKDDPFTRTTEEAQEAP